MYPQTILVLSLTRKVLRFPRTRTKSSKMKNSNVRTSKHIKLFSRKSEILPRLFSSSFQSFCILIIANRKLSRYNADILKVLNYRKIQKCFPRMSKMCSIADDKPENSNYHVRLKAKLISFFLFHIWFDQKYFIGFTHPSVSISSG